MRRILFSLSALFALLLVLLVFSCEKAIISDENESSDADGNLRVSVFEIAKTPFGSLTRAAVSDVCTRLNFIIYDEDGTRLKYVNQELGKHADFGTANFQIEEGNYQLVVVAHSAKANPTTTNIAKIQFNNTSTGYTDTFLYYSEVVIGEEGVDLNVSLDRIVSLCRFVITDDYPADVSRMRFHYKGGTGAFDATTGLGSVNSTQTLYFDASEDQKQFDLYTFLHELSDNIALKVTALDASGNALYEREFDVPMEQNHSTWLSGGFFNGSGSSSTSVTSVTINTDWAGDIHLTF